MQRFIKTGVVFAFLLCLIPATLLAHEFSGQENIGFTFHVEPADHPTMGVPTTMFLRIEDKDHLLLDGKKLNCQCTLSIVRKGNTEAAFIILNTNQLQNIPYTFQNAGAYTVTFRVEPKVGEITPAAFEKSFPIYVATPSSLKRTIEDWIVGIITGAFLLGVGVQLFKNKQS